MKKQIIVLFVLAVAVSTNLFAQNHTPIYLQQPSDFITGNFEIFDNSGWLIAKRDANLSATNFLQQNKQHFGMGVDDNFTLSQTTTDEFDFMESESYQTHEKFNQTYKGVKVEFAEFFVHHKANIVTTLNGKLAEGLNQNATPTINESQAVTNAINHLGASNIYAWLDSDYENGLKQDLNDPNATYYPTGELLFAKIGESQNYQNSNFVLSWKFSIKSLVPDIDMTVYVNAMNGTIVKEESNDYHGSANLQYYGTNKYLDTKWKGGIYGHHILYAEDNGKKVCTKVADYKNNGSLRDFYWTNNYFDQNDVWDQFQTHATVPHWCISQSWDYFKNKMQLNGPGNTNPEVRVYAGCTHTNNKYSPGAYHYIFVGNQNTNYRNTIDQLGHEFTHAVIYKKANFTKSGESGAIQESFCDIFGCMIERYTQGGTINDWLYGEETGALRNFQKPSASANSGLGIQGLPSIYKGSRWYYGSADNGGIHHNMGVQNYWFYLLTEGSANAQDGTHLNIQVSGIGADKAARIAYYNLGYLGSNSNYLDASLGSRIAAINLFNGKCSNEYLQTTNAWAAVGIGSEIGQPLTISGPSTIYYYANGTIMGSMPKTLTANGGIPSYKWFYTGPWSTSSNLRGKFFNINNFNNDLNSGVAQLTDRCGSISKNITFFCIDCPISNPNGGGGLSLKLYPNPTRDIIQITADFINNSSETPIMVSIIDMNGSYHFQQNYSNYLPESIDVSSYASGEYIAVVQQGEAAQYIQFVKQ